MGPSAVRLILSEKGEGLIHLDGGAESSKSCCEADIGQGLEKVSRLDLVSICMTEYQGV